MSERQPRFAIAANDLRIRYDNLSATVALAPGSIDDTGRQKLGRISATLTDIDGALMRLKLATAETVSAIERDLDQSLTDGDRMLQELSAEVAAGRAAGRR